MIKPSKPELNGTFGAVASTHWLATATGMALLESGGNAFDAAVAAGFVLQVVEPQSNGFGGDLAAVFYEAAADQVWVVCGQGPMPRAATERAFDELGLTQIPGSGLLPATVPGSFGGWLQLLAECGTKTVREVLDPAISYAAHGYPLLPEAARAITLLAPLFRNHWFGSAEVYLAGGVPTGGSKMRNPWLAATLTRLVKEAEAASTDRLGQIEAAHRAFYSGFVAEAMSEFASGTEVLDATGQQHRGLIDADDLAGWQPTIEPSASIGYRGHTVHKPGSWTQGPVFLQQLALLEGFDLSSIDHNSGEYVHLVCEAAKLALADREAWYGDPTHGSDPLLVLLSPEYTAMRRTLLGTTANLDPRPGSVAGRAPRLVTPVVDTPAADPEWLAQIHEGVPNLVLAATIKSGDTCTVSVTDRWGNAVAAVPSGGWLKSSPVIPGLGISLGTRGQAMWLSNPEHPNALRPGKRPRTTLSPTVVVGDGAALAFGTPGGDRQDQWTVASLLAVIDHGWDLQSATEAGMFCSDHFPTSFAPHASRPGVVSIEENVGEATIGELRARGHRVAVAPAWSMGKVCMVSSGGPHGFVRAGASPRGHQAYAAVR